MKRLIIAAGFVLIIISMIAFQKNAAPFPLHTGEIFKDTDGKPVNAHGAGMLEHNGIFYLFGEIKKGHTWKVPGQNWEDFRVPAGGVSCYSSKDLIIWKNEGIALAPLTGQPGHDLDTGKVIERPKVIYNSLTRKFVMWMHVDANDYSYSQSGVAVSDKPEGPYKYLGSVKPNGQMARDMTLFKDDDDRAYLIYSSEFNKTMQVCLLSADYLSPTKKFIRINSMEYREAPALLKHHEKYFLITSGCTGWSPNAAECAVADSLLGSWTQTGNPCTGKDAANTYQSQSTYILKLPGQDDQFVFMADRWNKTDLPQSGYVWLPLKIVNDKPVISFPENVK